MTQRADIGEGDDINEADLGIADDNGQQQGHQDEPAAVPVSQVTATPPSVPPRPPSTPVAPHVKGLSSAQEATIPSQEEGPRTPTASFPRTLVGRQQPAASVGDEDLMELIRMQMFQSQADERAHREEQRNRREEDRRRWEEERLQRDQGRQEDRSRRQEADRCHEQMMQMIMAVVSAAFRPQE